MACSAEAADTLAESHAARAGSAPAWYALTVDTTADTIAADGKCSLREAVAIVDRVFDANNDCPLVASAAASDTIQFDASLAGTTIALSSNTPLAFAAGSFVSMTGPNAGPSSTIAIDGNGATRIVDVAAGANVSFQFLRFQNGRTSGVSPGSDGAGIRNAGVLSMDNCTLRANTSSGAGGAIDNENALTLSAVTLTNNSASSGGALVDRGVLSVVHGYIANNAAAGQAGGLDLRGQGATLSFTTVQNNSAGSAGSAAGGGIVVAAGSTLNLSSSLLGGNHVTGIGGGVANYGQISADNSTFAGNTATSFGGAIGNDSSAAGTSQIVASTFGNNTASAGNAIANLLGGISLRHSLLGGSGICSGSVTDAGGNIAADASCALGAGSRSMTDPQLGTLAYYGGATFTMPPSANSPAIDVIDAVDCDGALDQRAVPRPQGGKCDVGAVELQTDRIFVDGFDLWP